MNAAKIDFCFPGDVPTLTFACLMRWSDKSSLTILVLDTPLIRAKLVEFLLSNPSTLVAFTPCFVANVTEFGTPHEVIKYAFERVGPSPLSFNVTEAAKRLGISYSYLRNLIRLGWIKKVHGRVTAAEIDRYLKSKGK